MVMMDDEVRNPQLCTGSTLYPIPFGHHSRISMAQYLLRASPSGDSFKSPSDHLNDVLCRTRSLPSRASLRRMHPAPAHRPPLLRPPRRRPRQARRWRHRDSRLLRSHQVRLRRRARPAGCRSAESAALGRSLLQPRNIVDLSKRMHELRHELRRRWTRPRNRVGFRPETLNIQGSIFQYFGVTLDGADGGGAAQAAVSWRAPTRGSWPGRLAWM